MFIFICLTNVRFVTDDDLLKQNIPLLDISSLKVCGFYAII